MKKEFKIVKRSYGNEPVEKLVMQIVVSMINEQKGYEYAKLN